MKIRGVIFDLGEVLLRGLYGTEKIINSTFGLNIARHIFYDTPEKDGFFRGKITEEHYWQSVIQKHNLPLTVHQLKYCVRANFAEIDGTRNLIERLKKRGYVLDLLSVHAKEWIADCEARFCYRHLFDATCYSFDNGFCKPEPASYQEILEKLNLQAQECLFIDDRLVNVEAAIGLGLQGIQFISAEDLQSKLVDLHLLENYDFFQGRPKPQNHICTTALIVRDGKVLMGLREYEKGRPLWTFPGGRCDLGERPEDGLKREVLEEIGVDDLKIVRHLGEKEGAYKGITVPDHVFVYECSTAQEPRLMEPEKFIEWRWFSPSNLPQNLIDPADVNFVRMLF